VTGAPMPERSHGRAAEGLRPTTIQPGFVCTATGSALISVGETRVICTLAAAGIGQLGAIQVQAIAAAAAGS